mmetsp:Transcript_40195/g.72424  ORF Transcript_40195/g.72424 Transcript_40195/m.72424 type:complete len:258 (+) Transcript_40195:2067-2840(+)
MRRQHNLTLLRSQPLKYLLGIHTILLQQKLHRPPNTILDHGQRPNMLHHPLHLFILPHQTHPMMHLGSIHQIQCNTKRLHHSQSIPWRDINCQFLHLFETYLFRIVGICRTIHSMLTESRVKVVHDRVFFFDHLGEHVGEQFNVGDEGGVGDGIEVPIEVGWDGCLGEGLGFEGVAAGEELDYVFGCCCGDGSGGRGSRVIGFCLGDKGSFGRRCEGGEGSGRTSRCRWWQRGRNGEEERDVESHGGDISLCFGREK